MAMAAPVASSMLLYLVKQGLLDIPVLYLSRHIVRTKADIPPPAAGARERCLGGMGAVHTERSGANCRRHGQHHRRNPKRIDGLQHRIRNQYKFYSQDLINNLFTHPYTQDRIH